MISTYFGESLNYSKKSPKLAPRLPRATLHESLVSTAFPAKIRFFNTHIYRWIGYSNFRRYVAFDGICLSRRAKIYAVSGIMKYLLFLFVGLTVMNLQGADLRFYLGDDEKWNSEIPTPASALGYEVGEWHVRHDQLASYMRQLAEASDRVLIQEIGKTHEQRSLLHLTISSPENLSRIDEIMAQHKAAVLDGDTSIKTEDMPIVVWLGYSVHGNESSGANASMVVAYQLAAAESVSAMLEKTVIILDPSLNPDGLSRFAQWANMHKGVKLVDDDSHREHREAWPSGRTNHYWFDLNRDWLLLQHPESRARIRRFHEVRPTILTDFHEMGTDSTFFFQPGIPTRQNPLTPDENFTLTSLIARSHADAFDSQGVLYYSEQLFDDFYYGKGSTYPDIQGSIGILFEQASTRGHLRRNSYGPLTFADTIKNQVTASFSTLAAAEKNRTTLLQYQRDFFPNTMKLAAKDKVKAYVFGTGDDGARAFELARILLAHQIEFYRLAKPVPGLSNIENGYIVPLAQKQFRLIKSLFEPNTTFKDQTFYDVSTWHFPSAFWADSQSLDQKSFDSNLMGEKVTDLSFPSQTPDLTASHYAYLMDWGSYYSPRAAYRLMEKGVKLRFAVKTFTAKTHLGKQHFPLGTVIVPAGIQTLSKEALLEAFKEVGLKDGVKIFGLDSGLTPEGIDLGSPSAMEMPKPKPLLLVGGRVTSYEAGEIWHLLDNRFQMPVVMAEVDAVGDLDLSEYTHLIMVNGTYSFDKNVVGKIKEWVGAGGVLIAMKNAVKWVADNQLAEVTIRKPEKKEEPQEFLAYGDRTQNNALQRISGTIFNGMLDRTHPLGYGVDKDQIALFRTNTLFLEPHKDPYSTPVHYTGTPLVSGYVSSENLELIKNSAAVIAVGKGRGAIILMADNPNFRGYWYGTNKLLFNGLFFGSAISDGRRR